MQGCCGGGWDDATCIWVQECALVFCQGLLMSMELSRKSIACKEKEEARTWNTLVSWTFDAVVKRSTRIHSFLSSVTWSISCNSKLVFTVWQLTPSQVNKLSSSLAVQCQCWANVRIPTKWTHRKNISRRKRRTRKLYTKAYTQHHLLRHQSYRWRR